MIDYRTQTVGSINEVIASFRKSENLRSEVLDGLLRVAVWHSIKDGQTTPAVNLLASIKGQKEQVSLYLTKFGNLQWTKKDGLKYCKAKGKVQFGLEKANEVFESLPTLEEAFPSKEKQYRDMPFMASIKHILKRAEEVRAAGKTVVFSSDEEKELFTMMQTMAAKAV